MMPRPVALIRRTMNHEKSYNASVRAMIIAVVTLDIVVSGRRIKSTPTFRGKGSNDIGACVVRHKVVRAAGNPEGQKRH